MSQNEINNILKSIIRERPNLGELAIDKTIVEYFKPAIFWKKQQDIFTHAEKLQSIIIEYIVRLYGEELASEAAVHLSNSWVVETGAHLHIPRRHNNVGKTEGPQINSLLFQGQVLWAMANYSLGHNMSISLNSGRVPLDNTNSGAYLDLPALKLPITLASKKKHPDSPQSIIPARTKEDIIEKLDLIEMYKKQRMLPEEQYQLGHEILLNFLNVQSNFSDQVATSHALMLNKVLPIKQVTIDSEHIGRDFVIAMLKDPKSITYALLQDKHKRQKFLEYLGEIRTGWTNASSPFYFVAQKGEGYRLTNYEGELDPEVLIKGLEENTLWLTGVMKFFVMMVDGGMLPVGGWTQTGYCTQIKTQSVKLLREIGYEERAKALTNMPTHIAAVGPCWGIHEVDGNLQLLDALTLILDPSLVDLRKLTDLTGNQTLLAAAPTLYEFLLGEPSPLSYKSLTRELSFACIQ